MNTLALTIEELIALDARLDAESGTGATSEPRPAICKHRSEAIGKYNCGCAGSRAAYRCTGFIRPNVSPPEQAFCTVTSISKPLVTIPIDGQTITLEAKEILICSSACEAYTPSAAATDK